MCEFLIFPVQFWDTPLYLEERMNYIGSVYLCNSLSLFQMNINAMLIDGRYPPCYNSCLIQGMTGFDGEG